MTATQTISVEITLDAEIEATGELCDYGVDRSPVWTEWTAKDWADYTVDIAGVTVKLIELPEPLRLALWDCAIDGIDDNGWEQEEREYE